MIRIAISQAAFDAIAATLPLGPVAGEPERHGMVQSGTGSPCHSREAQGDARSRQEKKLFRRDPSAGGGHAGAVNASRGFARLVNVEGGGAEQRMIQAFPGKYLGRSF